jgi:hypothetical protein
MRMFEKLSGKDFNNLAPVIPVLSDQLYLASTF